MVQLSFSLCELSRLALREFNVAGIWSNFCKYLVDSLQSVQCRKVRGLISVSYRHTHTSESVVIPSPYVTTRCQSHSPGLGNRLLFWHQEGFSLIAVSIQLLPYCSYELVDTVSHTHPCLSSQRAWFVDGAKTGAQ
jgi:hypothetical protein